MKVLAIDDDVEITALIASAGDSLKVSTHCVSDSSLIEDIDVHAFNLVFLDLLMPGKDGVEVVRELSRQQFSGQIVLMSGFDKSVLAAVKDLAHEHHLNVLTHLSKPFRLEGISGLISQAKALRATISDSCPKVNQLSLEQIQSAMDEDRVCVYYQPQIDLTSHRLVGVEALVRLKLNDKLISPDHFIPIAEKFDLINSLTKLIIYKALTDFKLLLEEYEKLTLSINLSSKNLEELDFADWLEETVQTFEIPASKVILEVTETEKILSFCRALDVLSRLRLKGFKISIDDFGTGNAVLAHIKRLPVTELKIDRSFVRDALDSKKSRALIKNTVRLCEDLDLDVIAEGIEDDKTEALILQLGCQIGQGFLYSEAISFDALQILVKEHEQNAPMDSVCTFEQDAPSDSLEVKLNAHLKRDTEDEIPPSTIQIDQSASPDPLTDTNESEPLPNCSIEESSEAQIDFILPLSGRFAFIGYSQKLGAELAFLEARDRIDQSKLALRFQDDTSDLKRLVKAIKKQTDDKTLAVVGPAFPLIQSSTFIKQTQNMDVPIIAPFNGSDHLRQPTVENIYNFKPGFKEEMLSIVAKLRGRKGKTLFVLARGKLAKTVEPICATLEDSEIVYYDPQDPDAVIKYAKYVSPLHLVFFGTARVMTQLIEEANNEQTQYYATSLVGIGMIKRLLVRKAKVKLEITDPLPDFQSNMRAAKSFRKIFWSYQPQLPEKFMNTISFEMYLVTKLLLELYHKNNQKLDRGSLKKSLESLFSYDLGLESPVAWGEESRQLLHQVYHIKI